MFILTQHACPCYCGGEGLLELIACAECGVVVARCDEVNELIRDLHVPQYLGDESICYPNQPCPFCGRGRFGDFRPATETELRTAGLRSEQFHEFSRPIRRRRTKPASRRNADDDPAQRHAPHPPRRRGVPLARP